MSLFDIVFIVNSIKHLVINFTNRYNLSSSQQGLFTRLLLILF